MIEPWDWAPPATDPDRPGHPLRAVVEYRNREEQRWLLQGWAEDAGSRQQAWLSAVTGSVIIELGAGTANPSLQHFSQRVIHQFRLLRINPNECEVPTRLDVGRLADGLAVLGP